MENKIIFKKEFKTPVNGTEIKYDPEKDITIGNIELRFDHQQDCCESVYADTSVIKYYLEELSKEDIFKIEIKKVEEDGVCIFFYFQSDWVEERTGVFIPCYNSQNGYYSNELIMSVKENGIEIFKTNLQDENCVCNSGE